MAPGREVGMFDHDTYLSPLTWRYGSDEMRASGAKLHKRRSGAASGWPWPRPRPRSAWSRPSRWPTCAPTPDDVDIDRAEEIEAEIRHDLMAEITHLCRAVSRRAAGSSTWAPPAMDIEDNADALRLREALDLMLEPAARAAGDLAGQIEALGRPGRASASPTCSPPSRPPSATAWRSTARTCWPTWHELRRVRDGIRGKGIKGAVGTVGLLRPAAQGTRTSRRRAGGARHGRPRPGGVPGGHADLPAQAGLAGRSTRWPGWPARSTASPSTCACCKSPPFGEWSRALRRRSRWVRRAMPFKRNPINAENMDSLARCVAALPRVAWDNAAHSLLERTLDDSANRRLMLPEAFLVSRRDVWPRARAWCAGCGSTTEPSARNLATYGIFAATERVLMELVRAGADRQAMHERIRRHSLAAWQALQAGGPNPLLALLTADPAVLRLPARRAHRRAARRRPLRRRRAGPGAALAALIRTA